MSAKLKKTKDIAPTGIRTVGRTTKCFVQNDEEQVDLITHGNEQVDLICLGKEQVGVVKFGKEHVGLFRLGRKKCVLPI